MDCLQIIMSEEGRDMNTVELILQEAHERVLQQILLASREGERIRQEILSAEKYRINEQFVSVNKNYESQCRVATNSLVHHYRMLKIKRKYQLCQQIFQEVQHRLQLFSRQEQYKGQYKLFLLTSIVQGLVRMSQDRIYIRCLERDKPILEQIIPLSTDCYNQYMQQQIGLQFPIQLSIAKNMKLQPKEILLNNPLKKSEEERICTGGVILADETGNITFKGTLDSRLNILRQICLPVIREIIWPTKKDNNNSM